MRPLAAALLATLLTLGCSSSYVLVVDVRTDLAPGLEFAAVRTELLDGPATDHQLTPSLDYASGARVAELEVEEGLAELEVALLDAAGEVVLARPVVVDVHGPAAVTVVLSRDCVQVDCGDEGGFDARACLGGACVSAECTPERPELCDDPACVSDADCGDAAPSMCARAACVGGACLSLPDDTPCGPEERCVPDRGCVFAGDPRRCAPPDDDVLLQLEFDDESAADALGAHPGAPVGEVAFVEGPTGCGRALSIPRDGAAHVEVPDSEAWHLAEGSLDFWLRHTGDFTGGAGVLSRDRRGNGDGHFSVLLGADDRLVIRVQEAVGEISACTRPLEPDAWHHVGVNFGVGGLEVWIDGERHEEPGPAAVPDSRGGIMVDCVGGDFGLADAEPLAWVLGASGVHTNEDVPTRNNHLRGGALDHLRVSRVRRDFARP